MQTIIDRFANVKIRKNRINGSVADFETYLTLLVIYLFKY